MPAADSNPPILEEACRVADAPGPCALYGCMCAVQVVSTWRQFDPGRRAAALANVSSYEAALAALHPDDAESRAWYRARLNDTRIIAGLEPLTGGHLAAMD
jgi:hypothetical protein